MSDHDQNNIVETPLGAAWLAARQSNENEDDPAANPSRASSSMGDIDVPLVMPSIYPANVMTPAMQDPILTSANNDVPDCGTMPESVQTRLPLSEPEEPIRIRLPQPVLEDDTPPDGARVSPPGSVCAGDCDLEEDGFGGRAMNLARSEVSISFSFRAFVLSSSS